MFLFENRKIYDLVQLTCCEVFQQQIPRDHGYLYLY